MKKVLATILLLSLSPATKAWQFSLHGNKLAPSAKMKVKKLGQSGRKRLAQWQTLIKHEQHSSVKRKLEVVNDYFNRFPYAEDIHQWGQKDYWATPVDFIASNGGDCEDFAIAKLFTLTAMGVDTEKLRITYAFSKAMNVAHMVLTYHESPDVPPLVLDNISSKISAAPSRKDLVPKFSFNRHGVWKNSFNGTQIKTANDGFSIKQLDELMHRWYVQMES